MLTACDGLAPVSFPRKATQKSSQQPVPGFPVWVRKSGLCFLSTCCNRKSIAELLPKGTLLAHPFLDSPERIMCIMYDGGRRARLHVSAGHSYNAADLRKV